MARRGAQEYGAPHTGSSHTAPGAAGGASAATGTHPVELTFTISELGALRRLVSRAARSASLDERRTEDLTLAVNELAANSVRHAGGCGTLRIWRDDKSLMCEVRDQGHIAEPWRSRVQPDLAPASGRGLWLVDQLCDAVQIRSSPRAGSAVRVQMRLQPAG